MKQLHFWMLGLCISCSACSIRYQGYVASPPASHTMSEVTVLKSSISPRLEKKWRRKGLIYYHLSIYNATDTAIRLNASHLVAVAVPENRVILSPSQAVDATKFNLGIFYGLGGFGLTTGVGYTSSRGLIIPKYAPYITLPILTYAAINVYIATKSRRKFTADVANYYLLDKILPAKTRVNGFVLVESNDLTTFALRP